MRKIWRAGSYDEVFVLDQNPASQLVGFLARAKRKNGFTKSISRLYSDSGWQERITPSPAGRLLAALSFGPSRVRRPDDLYEGFVELELLGLDPAAFEGRRLASFGSLRSWRPPPRDPQMPRYLYCSVNSSWGPRSLSEAQWHAIFAEILTAFPDLSILVQGPIGIEAPGLAGRGRIHRFVPSREITPLFEAVAHAEAVLTVDSFPVHVASLYDIPVIGFFGPARPHRFAPTSPRSTVIDSEPACSPCVQDRSKATCARGLGQCVSFATVPMDQVIAGVRRALEKGDVHGR